MPIPPYFIGPLAFECPPDDDAAMIITRRFTFVDSKRFRVEVEPPFRTDGASVRKLLEIPVIGWLTRQVLGGDQFTGPFRWPAIPHDEEYSRATDRNFWRALVSRQRAAADRRFFEGARCKLVVYPGGKVINRIPAAWWRAAAAHAILRAFGWCAWMENARKGRA